jgi:hypothetical protein
LLKGFGRKKSATYFSDTIKALKYVILKNSN